VHAAPYTPEMVERICGTPKEKFLQFAQMIAETSSPTKTMTSIYALGCTQHSRDRAWVSLGLSGLALLHPSLFFLTHIFGGGQNTRMIHPRIGVVQFFSFFGSFFRFVRLNLWVCSDTIWMLHLFEELENREEDNEELVEIGKVQCR
jgi:hypothetical protein